MQLRRLFDGRIGTMDWGTTSFAIFFFEIELLIFMVIGLVLQLTEALSHTGRHLADTAAMIE